MDQISVVIPTQERLPALKRTLGSLADQELGRDLEIELIVVCSGPSVSYPGEVQTLVKSLPIPSRVMTRLHGGAAGARNMGVGAASSDLILFLNDDTPPLLPDLIRTHHRLHRESPDEWRAVMGPSVWDSEIQTTPVMEWLTRTGKMHEYGRLNDDGGRVPRLYANNLSMYRAPLEAVGGFDERFWRYGWAEYDLALRLVERGFRVTYVPELVVGHHHHYTLRDSLRRMESVGRGANLFNRVHRSRDGLTTPAPGGVKAWVGRRLAPVATHVPVPAWLPQRLRDSAFRTLHYAALARGYAREPIPEGSGPEGGIPSRAEPIS